MGGINGKVKLVGGFGKTSFTKKIAHTVMCIIKHWYAKV